jgi:subtilase family serine protease
MKSRILIAGGFLLALVGLLFWPGRPALTQGLGGRGRYYVPDSSVERAGDNSVRAHTNHIIFLRAATTQVTTPEGLSPATLRSIYNLPVSGPNSGSGVIAIVDAYNYPTATADFNTFSTEFGLPLASATAANGNPTFEVEYASGKKPAGNSSWNLEAALDIEWAHAMAPDAQIILVEANSDSYSDLFTAVKVAGEYVACGGTSTTCSGGTGEGEVSMSWGGSEFSTEKTYDSYFNQSTVVYMAAAGDTGGEVSYPSASPDVISAGGTTLEFSSTTQSAPTFTSEIGWSDGGGGPSKYESVPSYQSSISGISSLVGSKRGTPDVSFDADPNSGVSVYESTAYEGESGWWVVGGTSVSTPSLAGIFNAAAHSYGSSEHSTIYSHYASTPTSDYGTSSYMSSDFRDITSGKAGKYSAGLGWDFVTGVGSPLTYTGK